MGLCASMCRYMAACGNALLKAPTNLCLPDVLHLRGDASNLCHNTLCINPSHISLELHWLINSRKHMFSVFIFLPIWMPYVRWRLLKN